MTSRGRPRALRLLCLALALANYAAGTMLLSAKFSPEHFPSPNDIVAFKFDYEGYLFMYITYPHQNIGDGSLLYFDDRKPWPRNSLSRPKSRLLKSANIIKYINSGSEPKNPDYMVVLPRPAVFAKGSGPSGATLAGPEPQPSGNNAPREIRTLTGSDVLSAGSTFLLGSEVFGKTYPSRACWVDPMATISPIDYQPIWVARAGTDRCETVIRVGRGFAQLLVSSAEGPPLEAVVVPRESKLKIMWPSPVRYEPVHSNPATRYKTYVLASAFRAPEREFLSMVDVAGSMDESTQYVFQSSHMHIAILMLSVNTRPSANVFLMRRVMARAAMAAFGQIQAAVASNYLLLQDWFDLLVDLRIALGIVPSLALGGSSDSAFFSTDRPTLSGAAEADMRKAIGQALATAAKLPPWQLSPRVAALTAAYATESVEAPHHAIAMSLEMLKHLHDAGLRDTLQANATTGKALFFALTMLTDRTRALEPLLFVFGRQSLMLATSMCTEEMAATANVNVQEAYVKVSEQKSRFSLLDYYNPCAAALRFDLSEYPHRLYAALAVGRRAEITQYLESAAGASHERGGAAAVEERLSAMAMSAVSARKNLSVAVMSAFVPEALRCSPDVLDSAIMVLPVTHNGSYIVGRRSVGHGLSYRVGGVSVDNQIFITYVQGVCGSSRAGSIESTKLPPAQSGECPYCGCVLLRYNPDGTVRFAILVANEQLQRELVAAANSTIAYFNPSSYDNEFGNNLLLFPNGSVVRVVAFEAGRRTALSVTYIISAVVGTIVALILLGVTIRMIVVAVGRSVKGFKGEDDEDDEDAERATYNDGSSAARLIPARHGKERDARTPARSQRRARTKNGRRYERLLPRDDEEAYMSDDVGYGSSSNATRDDYLYGNL